MGGVVMVPTITKLSTLSAAAATPVATATILQHTVGFPSAETGMVGERRPVIQVFAGARDMVEPKDTNVPNEPATPYWKEKLVALVAALLISRPH